MSTSKLDHFTLSPNHESDRSDIHLEIKNLLTQALSKGNAIFEPLKGEARRYGDYVCFGVLEICEKLRENNPRLFYRQGPKDIAEEIMRRFVSKNSNSDMIKGLNLHDAGILTFRLEGSWMAKRIEKMLNDGIDTWAPRLSGLKRSVFVFPTTTISINRDSNADMVRGAYIKEALFNMFLYSGVDAGIGSCNDEALIMVEKHFTEKQGEIISKGRQTSLFTLNGPSNDVYTDLATLWYGVETQKADRIIYMTPHRLREYIQQCHIAAAEEGWLPPNWKTKARPTCCGFRTFSGEQQQLPDLWHRYTRQAGSLQRLSEDAGYTMEASFECAFKFTCLKSHRLAECIFKYEDIVDEEGNTFVSLLKTQALVRSLVKTSPSTNLFKLNVLAGRERELGLHLVEFTEVIARACLDFWPHIVCEYLCNLCKLFTCYYREDGYGHNMLGLCEATEVVMNKCFHLLGIAPSSSDSLSDSSNDSSNNSSNDWTPEFVSFFHRTKASATDYHIIPSSETDPRNEHLNSRFEMFSMNVSIANSYFDRGTIFGTVLVVDTHRSADGWVMLDEDDDGFVSYFNREWHHPVDMHNGSYIPLGNPSCFHSIPFSSSIKVEVLVKAISEKKDQSYLLGNCMSTADFSKFWAGDSNTKCGTLKFEDDDGRILLDYVAIKDAVDTTMNLTFYRVKPVRVSGSIMACYGDDVLGDNGFFGQYNAVIFQADPSKFIGDKPQEELPLHKSALAVPANGDLKIKVFLQDAESKDIIMDDMKVFRKSESLNGYSKWKIEGKNGTFDFRVKWVP
ncbi:arginine--tRNA ligase, chloroplastic/mitochondrial [Tanacetum coccineum]